MKGNQRLRLRNVFIILCSGNLLNRNAVVKAFYNFIYLRNCIYVCKISLNGMKSISENVCRDITLLFQPRNVCSFLGLTLRGTLVRILHVVNHKT